MKIAFFSDIFYPELSGITDTVLLTGTELAHMGHDVHYFVPAYSKKNYITGSVDYEELDIVNNVKIHRIFSFPVLTPTLQGRAIIPNVLRAIIGRNKFDIIHTHTFFGAGIDGLVFSKIKNIPLIGTNHTVVEAFSRYFPIDTKWTKKILNRYMIWYYNRCDFITTPSKFLIEDMKSKGFHKPSTVISNPIEKYFFTPRNSKDALKKELNFSKYTILYVGRISSEKNIEVLIDAFISLAQEIPEASLILIGQGILRKKLEKKASNSSVADRIKFMGPFLGKNKKKLYDIFHASDVFVMPSISESQSMVMFQAMACGIPIIAARATSNTETVTSEIGYVFDPDNKKELQSFLRLMHDNVKKRNQIGNYVKNFVLNISTEKIALEWENIYVQVLREYKKH